jgi:hypothetical protein
MEAGFIRRQEKRNGNPEYWKCNERCTRAEMRASGLLVPGWLGQVLQRRMRGHGKSAGHRLPLQSLELQGHHALIARQRQVRFGF